MQNRNLLQPGIHAAQTSVLFTPRRLLPLPPLLPLAPVSEPLSGCTGTADATDSQALTRNVPPEPTQVSKIFRSRPHIIGCPDFLTGFSIQWWQWLLAWMQRPLKFCYAVIYGARRVLTVKRT